MITFFRSFFQSKLGVAITLAFLGLIAFAFASSDVANTATFGGVAGGDRVATVGDRRMSTSDFSDALTRQLDQARQQNPTITMEQFVAQDGDEAVLNQMLQLWAIAEYGEQMGLRTSKRLIDSEIMAIPGFIGVDGEFDQDAFRLRLRELRRTEEGLRDEVSLNLMAQQLVMPAAHGARLPESMTRQYARLLGESRTGRIAALPAVSYAPEGDPEEGVIAAYYQKNREDYTRPERRILRYGVFGEEVIGDIPTPTEEQIARRFQRDAVIYAPTEIRGFTRLVVPTQGAAQAVADEVSGGMSLEASALSKGLTTVRIEPVDQATLTSDTSAAVAQAAFAAGRGGLSAPAQGDLGWYVLRVDSVEQIAGRTLDQARTEIAQQLTSERRTIALNDLTARIEADLSDGKALSSVAEDLNVEIRSTPPVTAAGQIYGTPDAVPQLLAPLLSVAFEIDEGEAQLEQAGEAQFILYDVSEITQSAVAPLDEIKDNVTLAWRRDEGMRAAGEAAKRVLDRMDEGSTLAEALRAEDATLPPPGELSLNRRQLNMQRQQGQVPPPLMLMFSMAEGTAKRLELDQNDRWFVVELMEIDAPELAADDEDLPLLIQSLGDTIAGEYTDQLVAGIEGAVEAETNQTAIDAVIAQLTGQSN